MTIFCKKPKVGSKPEPCYKLESGNYWFHDQFDNLLYLYLNKNLNNILVFFLPVSGLKPGIWRSVPKWRSMWWSAARWLSSTRRRTKPWSRSATINIPPSRACFLITIEYSDPTLCSEGDSHPGFMRISRK